MVKVVSVYDEDKIKQISKPLATKGIIGSSIFTAFVAALAIFMLVKSSQQ